MRTQDLIDTLAADLKPRTSFEAALAPALALALAATAAVFFTGWGLRGDIAHALETARFLAKPALGLVVATTALWAVVEMARPGAADRGWRRALLLGPTAALTLVVLELAALPAEAWGRALMGDNALVCLVSIPLIAMPMFVALVTALRHGAPTAPRVAGAVAGLAAAGFAAVLYALFCTDDSPLFVATWYTLAAGIVAGVGALVGGRFLRW